MSAARRFYRLPLVLGALGAITVVAVVALAVSRLNFEAPPVASVAQVCQKFLLPSPGLGGAVTAAVAALGMLVLIRAARSLVRQVAGQRRFLRGLLLLAPIRVSGVAVIRVRSDLPLAFCAGFIRPRIYLSTAAQALLSEAEVETVIAHELHHQRRHDPLRLLVARTLSDALFFMPVLRRLGERYSTLAEIAADEAAVRRTDRRTLAGAVLSFGEHRSSAFVMGIDPQRVDHLLGQGARWEMPVSVLAGSLVALAALIGAGVAGAALTAGGSINVVMVAVRSCMVLMTALPTLVLLAALSRWGPLAALRRTI